MKRLIVLFTIILMAAFLLSCGKKGEVDGKTGADGRFKTVATVNGIPITEYDVQLKLRMAMRGGVVHQEEPRNILQNLVREELIYQKSLELGLDKDQAYRRKMREIEAQVRAFQRQEMSTLYMRDLRNKVTVTDAEAQDYFTKNSKTIQTKLHVWQIFYKGKYSEIAQDYQDLKKGMPFEKVAAKSFPNLPPRAGIPWDLGYLSWSQIPPPWKGIVDRLEPGGTTDIIKGPNERFWVIKLVEKMDDPKITFTTEKEKILEVLRMQKIEELQQKMLSQMMTKAKIVFPK